MEDTIKEETPKAIDGETPEEVADGALENEACEAAEAERGNAKKSAAGIFKQYFTARRMAYIATFTALSFALRFLQFSIFTTVPFLKFDFSDVFVLICGYALGPVAGIVSGILKEVLAIAFSSTAGVGELANIVILVPFVLIPSIAYKKHKGIKSVLVWLSVACVVRTAWSFPVNLLLNFPAFMGFDWKLGMSMFLELWHWTTLFNFVKNIILAVSVMLLYKSVSRFIRLINNKFDERKKAKTDSQA